MTVLPMDPGRETMPMDDRICFLAQEKMFLDRYHLRVRLGSDEHDRNMLASACSHVLEIYKRGDAIDPVALTALESDVAAFLVGGAANRRANREARKIRDHARRVVSLGSLAALNLAAAYHPHRSEP